MDDLFSQLFDTTGFPQRWECGFAWRDEPWIGYAHIISDVIIFGSFALIPFILAYFLWRRRTFPFPVRLSLLALFIFACAVMHLIEAGTFWWPAYRLSAVVKMVTAGISAVTVVALVPLLRSAFRLRTPEHLEKEVQQQTRQLRRAHRLKDEAYARMQAIVATAADGIITID